MSLDKISVNILATAKNGFDVEYLIQGRNLDKSDHPKKELFQPGKYPFYWPGAVALFGGAMESGETVEQAFSREMEEELKLHYNPENLSSVEKRSYKWDRVAVPLYEELNDFFQGNVGSFFGPGLYEKVSSSSLGRERNEFTLNYQGIGTNLDWLSGREDHYFVADFKEPIEVNAYEGVGAIWLPHWVTRSISTTPCDKLAILDDMMRRVKSGKLQIEPPQKSK